MKHRILAALAAGMAPALAFAHHGPHDHTGLALGALHPFTAGDHQLALVAVGLLAGRLGGRAGWMLAAAFLGLLGAGMIAGFVGIGMPPIGGLTIVAGIVCALLAIAPPRRFVGVMIALASVFAFFHGQSHGEWIIPGGEGWAFAAGLLISSAVLIAAGAAAAQLWARRSTAAPRPPRT